MVEPLWVHGWGPPPLRLHTLPMHVWPFVLQAGPLQEAVAAATGRPVGSFKMVAKGSTLPEAATAQVRLEEGGRCGLHAAECDQDWTCISSSLKVLGGPKLPLTSCSFRARGNNSMGMGSLGLLAVVLLRNTWVTSKCNKRWLPVHTMPCRHHPGGSTAQGALRKAGGCSDQRTCRAESRGW